MAKTEAAINDLVATKLDLVRQIRELKAKSTQVSIEILRTGTRDAAALAAVARW